MTTPTQLSFVSLQVSDLDASTHFYRDILEFQPLPQSPPDACIFATQSGAIFAIRKPLIDLALTNRLGWGVGLWFTVDNLDDLLQRIDEQAALIRGVQATPFGNTAIIADPDGYWLTIQETPNR